MKRIFAILSLLFLFSSTDASVDTLRHWTNTGVTMTYSGYTMQVARFQPPAPGDATTILVGLGGNAGTATLHLYGHEGGTAFPQLLSDLVTPITMTKNSGDTMLAVTLPSPVTLDNNNFFVAVDGFGSGVTLLSDTLTRTPPCQSSSGGNYYYQFMYDGTNWFSGSRAFMIDVVMDYPVDTSQNLFMDVTAAAGIDTNKSNQTMAWADYNNDGHLDLLVGNYLYENDGDGTFTDVSSAKGLWGNPRVSGFIDMDNDGDLDILFVGLSDSSNKAALFLNDGQSNFTGSILTGFVFPTFKAPHSLSVGDYNADGFPDVFISQLWDVYPNAVPNYLLRNDKNNGFQDFTYADMFQASSTPNRRSRGSQWVDFDDDGDMDLYVSNYYLEKDELWQNDGTGDLVNIATPKLIDVHNTGSSHGTGVDWMDYDNDGDMDLLSPQFAHPNFMLQFDHRGTTIYDNSGAPDYDFTDKIGQHGIRFEETHAGGAWGDLNNDGLVDLVMTVYYGCRYIDVYEQQSDHTFNLETFKYGIQNIQSGQDVAFADFDNDGKLDMASGKQHKIRLYRNMTDNSNNWIGLTPVSCTGNSQAIGARVWVYAGSDVYMQEVSMGRGQRMQKPTRLHFGIGSNSTVDSVVVRWPNGVYNTEVFTGLATGQYHTLNETDCTISHREDAQGPEVKAWPNPFGSEVNFKVKGVAGNVHLKLTDISGKVVHEEQLESVNGVAYLKLSKELSLGVYLYEINSEGQSAFGKIVKDR